MMTQSFTRSLTYKELSLDIDGLTFEQLSTLSHNQTRQTYNQYSELVLEFNTGEHVYLDLEDTVSIQRGTLGDLERKVANHVGANLKKLIMFE